MRIRCHVTCAIALAGSIAATPAAGQRTYDDVVALQNSAFAALQASAGKALDDFRESLAIAQTLGRPRLLAVLFMRLGEILDAYGEIQNAVIAYETGLKALAEDKQLDVRGAITSLTGVSKSFQVGRAAAPSDLYAPSLARDLGQAEADPALPASLLLAIGNAYMRQPQLDPALNAYNQALQRPEIKNAPALRAYALANSGEILRRQGKIDDAERALTTALDLLRQHAPALERRRALALLAAIHRDRGRAGQSLAEYQEAVTLYQQAQDPRGEGRAHAGLGLIHLQARRFADASTAYRMAIERAEQVQDNDSLWLSYLGLGQAQRATGDLAGAAASLERSLSMIEQRRFDLRTDEGKVTLLDSAQDAFDQLIGVHLDRASADPASYGAALAVAERARAGAMYDLFGSAGRRALNCAPPHLSRSPLSPGGQSAGGVPSGPRSPAREQAPGTPSGPPAIDVTQAAPGTRSGELAPGMWSMNDPRCAPGRNLAPVNPPALARVVFHVLPDRTAVFAVGSNGAVRGHVRSISREALARQVEDLRDALNVDADGRGVSTTKRTAPATAASDYRARLRRFHDDLIAPVVDVLPAGQTIVLEPHGPLWLVPFAALVAADGTFLADRWPIVYSPSAQILDEIRREPAYQRPADLRALIVGNPTPPGLTRADDARFRGARGTTVFQPLPGAEQEARAIAAFLPPSRTTVLVGAGADLATIEARASDATVVHLASHALAFPASPLDSFVMLAASTGNDGRLTARRVLRLTLNADLVTLSACQTGLGQLSGDGVIGLSRAFLVAGARSALVSQWSVSDAATAALMSAFYREYAGGVEDKARALQRARTEVRNQRGYDHPRYWAPFALIGSER